MRPVALRRAHVALDTARWLSQRVNTIVIKMSKCREPMSGTRAGSVSDVSASDGDVMICVATTGSSQVCAVLGMPNGSPSCICTNRARLRKREELVPAIATVIAERSRAHGRAFRRGRRAVRAGQHVARAMALEQFAASDMLGPPLAGGATLDRLADLVRRKRGTRMRSRRSSVPTTRRSPFHQLAPEKIHDTFVRRQCLFALCARAGRRRRSSRRANARSGSHCSLRRCDGNLFYAMDLGYFKNRP